MKYLITLLILAASTINADAQRYYTEVYRDYGNRGYNRQVDNRDRSNYRYWYSRMSRSDARKLQRYEKRLNELERCAWADRYISRREQRKIDEVKWDIDRLIAKYDRRGRYGDRYDRRNNRPRNACG